MPFVPAPASGERTQNHQFWEGEGERGWVRIVQSRDSLSWKGSHQDQLLVHPESCRISCRSSSQRAAELKSSLPFQAGTGERGKPFPLVPGNFSLFPKHFTLGGHLFTPGEAHVNIFCIFFSTEVSSPCVGGKNPHGFVWPGLCAAQGLDRDRSENKSKQKDKTRRGGRCLHCIIWQSFLIFPGL